VLLALHAFDKEVSPMLINTTFLTSSVLALVEVFQAYASVVKFEEGTAYFKDLNNILDVCG
jgi:hypothetical protein